ncbi:glycosyltransferase Gtf1 [Microlunatus endophyticus]|uniref:Glycosyltransferase Gtf1 n=1 Tax=Microlunatus endophyticus TaxID=1716077 RepID=A0A917VYS2_9ACTN|nr:glycosyltransferase [Microlunatus endophyticus]GGL46146.1 glycosyltransferase Gtf1 [Microlunatus endophyticus]
MRVFNINKAVGLASSGVEYAQKYRRDVLADIAGIDDYYVFTDYLATNPSRFTDRLGFERSQVLWIYNVLTGRDTLGCTLGVDDFIAMIKQPHAAPQVAPDHTDVVVSGSAVRYRIQTLPGRLVNRVEIMISDQLVSVEHYDESLNNIEHFYQNRLVRRTFYSPDGRLAAEQFYRPGPEPGETEITRTVITPVSPLYDSTIRAVRRRPSSFVGDVVLEGRSQFFQYVFARLFSRPDDVVIVDRALDVIDGIYPVIGDHRLYSIVHAEHYDLKQIEDGVLLWNNHYENVFTRPDLVDGFIVSTHRQQEVLEAQLAGRLRSEEFSVACIPVGVIKEPVGRPDYDRSAIVTASRLADEKHIDLLIRAVAAARKVLPGLRLDIYGEGKRDGLLAAVRETGTQDCVRLMGHQKLDGVLGSYGLYVSASTSEGFGLSLLEAMAEGLPIVGFDVDYGNRELVEPGVNGELVPWTSDDHGVTAIADAIVKILTAGSLDDMRKQSLRKAGAYTAPNIGKLWERLLRPEQMC